MFGPFLARVAQGADRKPIAHAGHIVPLGLPFGGTIATGGDDYYEVAALAAIPALVSMVLMLLAAGARLLYERHRRGAPPAAVYALGQKAGYPRVRRRPLRARDTA